MVELALPKSFKRLNLEEQKSVLKQLKDAARTALNKGWHIFPAPYLTKKKEPAARRMRVMTRKHWRNGTLEFLRIPVFGSTIRISLSWTLMAESAITTTSWHGLR